MSKNTIIAVYQDCFMCGSPDEKGKKMLADIAKAGKEFRKVSFATCEGQDLCAKAIENGVHSMPFFTDGVRFSTNYDSLINDKPEKALKVEAKAEKGKK